MKSIYNFAAIVKVALLLAVASILAPAAFAQSSTFYLDNSVRTMNVLNGNATVTGVGTAVMHGEATAGATANGGVAVLPNGQGGSFAINGQVSGYNTGGLYVVTTGAGNGFADLKSWSDGRTFGNVGITQPFGHLAGSIDVDGGMLNAVKNGTDLNMHVNNNQDIFGSATYKGEASLIGAFSQVAIPGGAVLQMTVADTKSIDGTLNAGRITFGGTLVPTGMTAGTIFGQTGMTVTVLSAGEDPAK